MELQRVEQGSSNESDRELRRDLENLRQQQLREQQEHEAALLERERALITADSEIAALASQLQRSSAAMQSMQQDLLELDAERASSLGMQNELASLQSQVCEEALSSEFHSLTWFLDTLSCFS